MADFTSVLSKKADDVVKPPVKPAGVYLAQISGLPSQENPTVQGTERVVLSFPVKLIAAQSGVDSDALSNPLLGDISSWQAFKKDFWIDDPQGEFALKNFLTGVLEIASAGKTLGEMVAESVGHQFLVTIIHKPFISKTTGEPDIAANLGPVAKA